VRACGPSFPTFHLDSAVSFLSAVALAPNDPILGLTDTYLADKREPKVNLGVGVYYDEQGRQTLPAAVLRAEQALVEQGRARGYIPIDGLPSYTRATQELLFGADSALLAAGRVVTAQTLGGTGALRVGAEFLKATLEHATVAISRPSWPNHQVIFNAAGFKVVDYPYYHAASNGLDFDGMLEGLRALQPGTVVLLHACCHNPTGVDLELSQWQQVADVLREGRLLPFVDMAYQGFDRGIAEDAEGIAVLLAAGLETVFIANSYSKSFSLYGERVGALSVVCADADEAVRVRSQVKQTIRANYSNPPTHGAALVAAVLGDAALRNLWESELTSMRERIKAMRKGLVTQLAAQGQPDFGFIDRQAGMFSYSGLSKAQVARLREEFAIYAVDSGRICVSALNTSNLEYVASAIARVVA